jgi:putative acyl-CoA dehydrogenase
MSRTHEVFNQSEPLVGHDLFEGNLGLRDGLRLLAPQLELAPLQALGKQLGQADMQTHARLANSHRPVLHTHSPQGQRIDQVEFHPSYHTLMSAAVAAGLHGSAWLDSGAGAHLRRAALIGLRARDRGQGQLHREHKRSGEAIRKPQDRPLPCPQTSGCWRA